MTGPRVPAVARLLVTRSAGRSAFVVLLGVCLLHLFGRSLVWRHEWMWAFYQFAFVTVLLGPVGAGVTAWDGARWGRARTRLAGAVRIDRILGGLWAASAVWVIAAFVIGQVLVVALVVTAGTPGRPGWRELLVAIGAAAMLLVQSAVGFVAGFWSRSVLAAPISALGCFLLTLYLFVAGPRQFVEVGGAGDTLVGLTPKVASSLLRTLLAVLLVVLLVAVTSFLVRGRWWREIGVTVLAAASVAATSAILVIQPSEALRPISRELVCVGSAPQVCAAPSYRPRLEAARAALLPYLDTLTRAGIPVPPRFVQGVVPSPERGGLSLRLLRGDADGAGSLILATYLTKACAADLIAFEQLGDEFAAFSWWLVTTTTGNPDALGELPGDAPAVLTEGNAAEQEAWARRTADRLLQCETS